MRKRRGIHVGLLFLLLAVIVGSLSWLTYREVRQEKLDHALFTAIYANQPKTAIRLLDEGADANARDNGNKPVRLHQVLIDLFNRLRGKKSIRQDKRLTPLLAMLETEEKSQKGEWPQACIHPENVQLLDALLDKGADIEARDEDGYTALMLACCWGYSQSTRRLVNKGADVNARGTGEVTALYIAVFVGRTDTVRILLNAGADPNHKINSGMSVLEAAKGLERDEIVALLKQAGAKE